jgi:hypothetical protein
MIDDRAYIGCGADPSDPLWPGGRAELESAEEDQ